MKFYSFNRRYITSCRKKYTTAALINLRAEAESPLVSQTKAEELAETQAISKSLAFRVADNMSRQWSTDGAL